MTVVPERIAGLSLACLLLSAPAWGNATITILNNDGAGEGFNDPTPATPVGGNPGTTIGQQRLIAFQFAADLWGQAIDSNVPIVIRATFDPLPCDSVSAVLGSASTLLIVSDFDADTVPPFPGSDFPAIWYHGALADKRAGVDLDPGNPDLQARFNSSLGQTGCLTGFPFYYGLDNNAGTKVDLVSTLLHEFAHGLGFSQFANVQTGAEIGGQSDVYGRNLFDTVVGLTWDQMSDAQRVASAVRARRLVWLGSQVTSEVPGVLFGGTPLLRINSPASIDGDDPVGEAQFGAPLSSTAVTGAVVQAFDASNSSGLLTTDACTTLTNAATVAGKIAFVDRGTCTFVTKVKNCQNAGAIGVIVANNVSGAPPQGMSGTDATITIPSVLVTLVDAAPIRSQLGTGVNASLVRDSAVRQGADASNRMMLYAPDPVLTGSSISHWDDTATPNLIMEPGLNSGLPHQVTGTDLTLALLRDVGWFPDADVDGLADPQDPDDDNDGAPDGSDCAPLDGTAFAVPGEISSLTFPSNHTTLSWPSAAAAAGSGTVYQLVRGTIKQYPVGSGAETCLGPTASTSLADATVPVSGTGYWYLVRGSNACGIGTYGFRTGGIERLSAACP